MLKKTKQILVIAFLIPFLMGCSERVKNNGSQINTPNQQNADGIQELIDQKEIFTIAPLNDTDLIQSFLDKYPGPLKSYTKTQTLKFDQDTIEEKEISGAFMIWDSCLDGNYVFNCQILITLLELRTNAITSAEVTAEDIQKALPLTTEDDLYARLLILGSFINTELEGDTSITQASSLELKDGSRVDLKEGISPDVYGLKKILAELANNKEEWEMWNGKGENSFFGVYNEFFGL